MVGWSLGLVRCWSFPFSVLLATFIAQHIYVDVATVLVETLHLEATFSIFIAYFFVWIGLVQYSEALLSRLFYIKDKTMPLWSKIGGAGVGLAKGAGAFVLASMVAYANSKVPEPPQLCWENRWIVRSARDSYLLPRMHLMARKLDDSMGKYVLSESAPRFHPNFNLAKDPFADTEKREEERGKRFVKGWRQFKQDLGEAFGDD